MNVRLAVQILSSSVSKMLTDHGPPEEQETQTARLCLMMDNFLILLTLEIIMNTKKNKSQILSHLVQLMTLV